MSPSNPVEATRTRASAVYGQDRVIESELHAGPEDSALRAFKVKAAVTPGGKPEASVCTPVQKPLDWGTFGATQIAFKVPKSACDPNRAVEVARAALQRVVMVTPPAAVTLLVSGFGAQQVFS